MNATIVFGLALLVVWVLSFFFSVRLSPSVDAARPWGPFELLMLVQIALLFAGGGLLVYAVL